MAALPFLAGACAAGFRPGERGVVREDDSLDETRGPLEAVDDVLSVPGGPRELAPVPGSQTAADAADLALRADVALRAHLLEEAASLFEAAARAAPGDQAWRYERPLADACLGLRRNGDAIRVYRALIASGKHPRTSTLYANLAVACYRAGSTSEAKVAAEEALAMHPSNHEAMKTLGLADLREGNREAGLARLRAALERNPRIPEAQLALAEFEAAAGDPESALGRYRKLRSWLPGALSTDYHRRWRDLFFPGEKSTAEELEARIGALEATAEKAPAKKDIVEQHVAEEDIAEKDFDQNSRSSRNSQKTQKTQKSPNSPESAAPGAPRKGDARVP